VELRGIEFLKAMRTAEIVDGSGKVVATATGSCLVINIPRTT